jgi:hypothetical protein
VIIEVSHRGRVDNELTGRDEQPDKHGPDTGQHRKAEQHGPEPRFWNCAPIPVLEALRHLDRRAPQGQGALPVSGRYFFGGG